TLGCVVRRYAAHSPRLVYITMMYADSDPETPRTHHRPHLPPRQPRCPRLPLLSIHRQQHAIERHLAPRLRLEQRDLDGDSRLGAELGATGREDGITHRARTLISTWSSVKPPHTAR